MPSWTRTIGVVRIWATVGLGLAASASAEVIFNVNSFADEIDDDTSDGLCHTLAGTCTLRAAVMQANKIGGAGATINLPAGIYNLTRPDAGAHGDDNGDLNLTSPESGDPVINILGSGAATTIIDAHQIDRIFSVGFDRTATISGLTLRNGFKVTSGGGAIDNNGSLTVSYCALTGNEAGGGGAISNSEAGITISHSTLSENSAVSGGAISNGNGTVHLDQCTLSGNEADEGGAIYGNIAAAAFITNSTISGNRSTGDGGGIYNGSSYGTIWTYNTTIAFNEADSDVDFVGSGGGIYNADAFFPRSSVIAGNYHSGAPDPDDCSGSAGLFGQNRFSTASGCDIVPQNADAGYSLIGSLSELGPLQFNGGSTRTHALVGGSDMIDGGSSDGDCLNTGLIDQRGGTRGAGTLCDIGAYEFGALPAGLIFADGFELGNLWAWG